MKELNVAVIGVGSWGKNHARAFSELKNVNLIGVFDQFKARAKEIAKQYECKTFNTISEIAKSENVDMVSIVTPTSTHCDIALEMINSGKHVLIEKPMTSTVEEAEKIIDAEKSLNVKVTVGFIERFNPVIIRSKQLILEQELGNLVLMSARRLGPFWPDRLKDVDVIRDVSIHDIDAFRYLAGKDPINLYARGGKLRHVYYDYAEIILDFGGGLTGFIESNYLTPHKYRKLNLTCENGIVEGDYMTQEYIVEDKEWVRKRKITWQEPLKAELNAFAEACINNSKPPITSIDGIKALKIAAAAIESIETHRVIDLAL
ncbi:MAG: Gfo/Idh/MocA family protein [Candidatus Heimdallarchaeaceae archaeon]